VDVDRGESLCPLCKSVTNTLVPFTARTPCRPGTEGNYFLPAQCPPYCVGVHTPASLDAVPEVGASAGELSTEAFRLSSLQEKPFPQRVASLHALFAHNLERGKLVSDGQFYDSCSQQGKLPWDIDNLSEAGVPRNLALLRTQHAMWSATAYTLLTATCNRIRERNVFASTPGAPQSTAVPLQLHDTDMSLLRHLLSLVWRSPSWVRNYNDFICKPLRALITGQSFSDLIPQKYKAEAGTPTEQFFTKTRARLCDLQRSRLSMPFEAVSTSMYPNAKLVGKVAKLAIDGGVPEEDAWAVLRSPLLSQDLHVIAIAAAASAANLPAFFALNQILCVAKLAQTLLEPVVTGQVDYFKLNEDQHTKSGASVRGRGGAKGDAKHSHSFELDKDGDKDSTPSKRSKTSQQSSVQADAMEISTPSGASSVPSISPLDASVTGLTQLRDLVCRAAGVPQSRAAPLGWNLLAIVLDSWIPFLEYAYHLQVLMKAISGIRTSEEDALTVPVSASANAVSSNLRHDANHQHLPQKFAHAAALLVALDLPSVDQLAASAFFTDLMTRWGEHFHEVHSVIEAVDRKAMDDSASSTVASAVPWIPIPVANNSSPALGHRKKWWQNNTSEQQDGHAAAAAKDSESISALDSLMWNMLNAGAAGPNQGMGIGIRAARGMLQPPQQDEVDEEQRMENAMEETDMPAAMMGEAMDDDSDDGDGSDGDGGEEGNPHAYAPHYLGYMPGYDEDEEEDGENDFDDDEENEEEEGGEGEEGEEGEEGDHSFYSAEEHEHDHDYDHGGEEDENEDSIDEWAERSDSDQFFGPDADFIDGLRSHYDLGAREGNQQDEDLSADEEEAMPGVTTSTPATPATKRPALHWKLQGVYPINPTVDFPSPELNALASVEQERNSATANLLQLMPVRAPLQGSLSGTHSVVGFNGARARYTFPDLSHMGIGLRHLNRVFIPLPTIYTDLYQMVCFIYLLSYLLVSRLAHCLLSLLFADQVCWRRR